MMKKTHFTTYIPVLISVFCSALLIACKSNMVEISSSSAYSEMSLKELNNRIDKSQKEALSSSPFTKSSGYVSSLIKRQRKERKHYIQDVKNILTEYSLDTIFLVEDYSEVCINCSADRVCIYQGDSVFKYELAFGLPINYKKDIYKWEVNPSIPIEYTDNEIVELKYIVATKGECWNTNPEIYGTEEVLGGGYTLYTVFYPDGRIESMYQRVWRPPLFRRNTSNSKK